MKAGLVIGIVLLVSGIIYAPQLNAQECEGYTDPSSATLDFVSFNPNNGKLVLRLNYCCTRHTSKDRCPITSSIAGECDTSSIWYMVYDGDWLYCVALCCNNNDCLCDPYDFYDHETFSCDIWTIIRGERRVQVWFKGEEIYDAVHVGFGIEDNKPEIRDFDALQFDGVPASANAIFDVDEIMGLRLECYWPETVEPFVSIRLVDRDNGELANSMTLPKVSAPSSHIGIYEVVSGWAILREVYGDDLDAYFDTPTVRNVDVFLTTNYECEPPSEEEHAIGTIKVAHYEYYIQGVCFFDDVNLERDSVISATEFEVVPIYMPQWKDDPTGQKNLPISYVRGTQLEIGAKICASHIPNHSMPFRFLGFGRSNGEYDSRFNIEPETGAYSTQVFYIWHLTQPDGVTVPGTIDSLDMGITWALHNSHSESIEEALLRTTYHELLVIDAQRPGVWGRANTLSLRKACHYANGLRGDNPNVGPIALKCMNETYDEASDTNDTWDYNPDLEPDTTYLGILRPYVPARYHKGQCADFANLLVTYMHDLGIAANSRYVWSGTHSPAAMYYNFWYWTESNPPNAKNVILSNELEVCDGEEKCWFFRYHQIMNISYPTVDISYDAVFNMSGPYDDWVRHYWEEDGVDFYDFPDFGTGRPTSSNYFHREYINHYWP